MFTEGDTKQSNCGPRIPDQTGIWKRWFLRREEKLEEPEKKPSEQGREPTANSTHMTSGPGIRPGPHWWEASAITTAPINELN